MDREGGGTTASDWASDCSKQHWITPEGEQEEEEEEAAIVR